MDEWIYDRLQSINAQLSKEEMPYICRPFEAMRRLSLERHIAINIPSELATTIFTWFEEHSPKGAHAMGSMFTSVFYYDAYFWPVEVPIAFGTVQLNGFDALKQMPSPVKELLKAERAMAWRYILLWTDSMDYGYGMDDLGYGSRLPKKGNASFAAQLTTSADRELRACVRLLTESRLPNPKALESARMAMEMFLKSYLAVHNSLTEDDAQKKFSHNLEKLVTACRDVSSHRDVDELRHFIGIYPPVGARYEGSPYPNQQLWSAFAAALRTGVTYTRSITDRDNRHQIPTRNAAQP